MSGEQIFNTDQNLGSLDSLDLEVVKSTSLKRFKKFIREWHHQNQFVYRTQLTDNGDCGNFWLTVDMEDLTNFDETIATQIRSKPQSFLPLFEKAAQEIYAFERQYPIQTVPEFQIHMISNENTKSLRELKSNLLGKLVTISGIIINSGKVQLKANKLCIRCKQCKNSKKLEIPRGMGSISIPRNCDGGTDKCPLDPFFVIPENSSSDDYQTLKIQECPEMVPTGEIPRSFRICLDRYLTGKLIPGMRVTLTGIYTLPETNQSLKMNSNTSSLKTPYIYGVGFRKEGTGLRSVNSNYTPEEIEKFHMFSQNKNVYDQISKSIAGAIYGSEDIKRAIACLLFGGSKKILPDQTRLRGDINVLLIGDPSTGKSQFLKFVERVAPIAVYTSGKGSSAAGLTASIIRDPASREFQLEGGAMVLADGGVVCIDEFDKMKSEDRVAIHEAMEQQTISVAKAGITTILNSRTSVLAAANPIFGRYDDSKAISDQIELQTTILSRFDCIFVVKDAKSEEHDKILASHILNLHIGKAEMEIEESEVDIKFLKKYIHYAKSKFSPRLNEDAANILSNIYVEDRQAALKTSKNTKNQIPITVRQLEAIIRLSESLAKMTLSNQVTTNHVAEAHRLFRVSTLNAISCGLNVNSNGADTAIILKIEESIRKRIPKDSRVSRNILVEELVNKFKVQGQVEIAISNMIQRRELIQSEKSKVLARIG